MQKLVKAELFLNRIVFSALRPQRHDLTVSEWADDKRVLSSKASAEPGRWRTNRTPYLREPMDQLSTCSTAMQIVMMFAAQLGKTETGNNFTGYVIDYAPGPMLMVQPTVEMGKRVSKQRIDPMIDESPCLREKIPPARARDSGNTVLQKDYPGGTLMIAGANSAAGLRSMPIKYLFLDEVDAYPGDVEGEGDPVNLAIARTRTFRNRKILMTSTPTLANQSRIETEFEKSDQRHFHVPCPHCDHKQILKFANLKWEKEKPETAQYQCESCDELIAEKHKTWMLEQGEWVATHPDRLIKGYHLSALYSPVGLFSWEDIVTLFEKSKGNPDELRVFVNTVLAETWNEKGEAPDFEKIYRRREEYPLDFVPDDGLLITAGVDVQRNRIEVELVAWGRNMRSWSIGYRVYKGDTSQKEVWEKFWPILNEKFSHSKGGKLKIRQLAIDSSDQTQIVYTQVRAQNDDRVIAIKGSDALIVPVNPPKDVDINIDGKRIFRGTQLWTVGVSLLKTELYGWLRQEPPLEADDPYPYGYCHFPQYDLEHFKRLTAESRRKKTVNGRTKYMWVPHYERNEQLDCRVYARAAAFVFGIDRFTNENWESLECEVKEVETPQELAQKITRRKGGWI